MEPLPLDPTSPIPAFLAILVALGSCLILTRQFGPPDEGGRFLAIDGLRGYLAFGVFLHHAMIWFFYLKTNQWEVPPSHLYTHFGQTSVALFFMITGFLFFSKILDGKTREIDWLRLYVSRCLRLTPLYAVAMIGLFVIVFVLSDGKLNESIGKLSYNILRWVTFTIRGDPDINGVERTSLIVAAVTWSLPYEWYFYFLLPILALVSRVRVPRTYVVVSATILILILTKKTSLYQWLCFGSGILAAHLVRRDQLCTRLRSSFFAIAAITLLCIIITCYPSIYGWFPLLLLSAVFVVVAAGNSIFGLLTTQVSRTLGEMAYSIYLLHGILLFVLFRFIVGFERSMAFDSLTHWVVVVGVTPILIATSYLTYKTIEHPALSKTNDLTAWLRARSRSAKCRKPRH